MGKTIIMIIILPTIFYNVASEGNYNEERREEVMEKQEQEELRGS